LFFITVTLHKIILKPLKILVSAIEKLRLGNYNFVYNKNRKDEIGTIFTEFEKTSSIISNYLIDLKDSERRLKSYIDKLPNINIKLDLDGRVILANSFFLTCLNKNIDEIYGKKFWELVTDNSQLFKEKIDEAILKGKTEFDCRFIRNNCENKIFHFIISVVKNDYLDNYLVIDGSDVTEKRKIDNELKQRSSELNALLDNLPGYVFFKDISGKYIAANQKFLNSLKKSYK